MLDRDVVNSAMLDNQIILLLLSEITNTGEVGIKYTFKIRIGIPTYCIKF